MATDTLSTRVAEEVRAMLARRGMNKSELARRLDVSHTWVTNRLAGHQDISLNDLEKFAEVLEVTVADLLPRGARTVTNGSLGSLADTPVQPHPVDVRSGVGHGGKRRTGRTGRSLQRAISHSPVVV